MADLSPGGTPTQPSALRTPSLHTRVTLIILALLAALLVVLGLTLDAVVTNRLEAQLRDRLLDRAYFASALTGQVDDTALAGRLEGEGISVRVVTSDGSAYTAGRVPVAEAGSGVQAGATGSGDVSNTSTESPGPPARAGDRSTPVPPRPGKPAAKDIVDNGRFLTVSETLDDATTAYLYADRGAVDDARTQVRFALILAAAVVLVLAALALVPVVRTALRPLTRITDVARGISEGDRGRRLRPDRPGTELGRLGVAFDDMLDTVEGAEQRLRDFLSDAAHELRTPIAGIRATSEHLLRDEPDRDERERQLIVLVRESDRAGRLVEDLLLMAQIDGGLELRWAQVKVGSLVAHCADARRSAHAGVGFSIDVPDALTVNGDEHRLTQVVGNLLDNAVQAAGATGRVTVRGLTTDDATYLDVSDDGPGVVAADRVRIFERLTRLDSARERRRGGFGLGLPIALGIARAHGGDLTYVDRPGVVGACFRLTLPRAPIVGHDVAPWG